MYFNEQSLVFFNGKFIKAKEATTCFFTGTIAEVVGLQSLDKYQFPMKWEESYGYSLMKLYKTEALRERVKINTV